MSYLQAIITVEESFISFHFFTNLFASSRFRGIQQDLAAQQPTPQVALQALSSLVNTLALGQVAASLNPALTQLASTDLQQQQQQELRQAFERQLKAQASQGNQGNQVVVGTVAPKPRSTETTVLSPAEQLQRSYQAHLEALKRQASVAKDGSPDKGKSGQTKSKPGDAESKVDTGGIPKEKSKSRSSKSKKTSKGKPRSKPKKKGGDEEAGSILLLLRKSFEAAQNNGSSIDTSSDDDKSDGSDPATNSQLSSSVAKRSKKK